ncbi:predicted protein [Histoplasma capsulatum G186AR]|uniref:Uncharacterized protein n=2 Tax=Ajellomyces capsulatus TaxID=5037 RepID=C0NHZ0_AJECG|nr:uncharacterized protein HCBG_02962 [Histoplasma capsulatum G186AR]EEH09425.1 predicted protein [Histoplasma capsulatum G186AR]KAG5303241.1 hypothetical protein I7I52_01178 [Histoplasma capsulatum]QSS68839.1 hypothetical protein I7I50_09940 [Histoplasma capsulatum G186AR]
MVWPTSNKRNNPISMPFVISLLQKGGIHLAELALYYQPYGLERQGHKSRTKSARIWVLTWTRFEQLAHTHGFERRRGRDETAIAIWGLNWQLLISFQMHDT